MLSDTRLAQMRERDLATQHSVILSPPMSGDMALLISHALDDRHVLLAEVERLREESAALREIAQAVANGRVNADHDPAELLEVRSDDPWLLRDQARALLSASANASGSRASEQEAP